MDQQGQPGTGSEKVKQGCLTLFGAFVVMVSFTHGSFWE